MKNLYKLFFLFPLYILCFCDRCFADIVIPGKEVEPSLIPPMDEWPSWAFNIKNDNLRDFLLSANTLILGIISLGKILLYITGIAVLFILFILGIVLFVKVLKKKAPVNVVKGSVKDKKRSKKG